MMVADHRKTSSELKRSWDSRKVKAALPAALDSEHRTILDELTVKDGKEFDRQYDQVQLIAHRESVSIYDAYSKNGENVDLKRWAATTLPH
jgi:putative membrane protein